MLNESVSAVVSATSFDIRSTRPAEPVGNILEIRQSPNLIAEFDQIVARYYADEYPKVSPLATEEQADAADQVLHWMDRVRAMEDSPSVIAARAHALRHWFAKHWWDDPVEDRDLEFEHATHLIESILARRNSAEASGEPVVGTLAGRDPSTGSSLIESAAAEWSECVAFINANTDDDSSEELAVIRRQRELEAVLSGTPARDFGDLRAKALVIKQLASPASYVMPFEGDDIEALTWSLLNDIAGTGPATAEQSRTALPYGSLDDAELIQAAVSMADLVRLKADLQQAEDLALAGRDKVEVREASAAVGRVRLAIDGLNQRVAGLRAGSLQGAAAKLQVMRLDWQANGYEDPTTAIIMTLSDDFERIAKAPVDPIHAAVAKCRSALDAYMEAGKADVVGNGDTPEIKAASDAYYGAWEAVCATKPTTIAGVGTFAALAVQLSNEMGAWDYIEEGMAALARDV